MAKIKTIPKKSKPAKAPAPRSIPIKVVLLMIVGVLLLIALLAFVSYRNQETKKRNDAVALAADKTTFARIEADMAATYENIVGVVGKPSKHNAIKKCEQIAHKYEDGDLYCNTGFFIEYRDSDADKINANIENIDQVLASRGFISQNNNRLVEISSTNIDSAATRKLSKSGSQQCDQYIETTYDKAANEYIVEQQIKCSRKVLQPVY